MDRAGSRLNTLTSEDAADRAGSKEPLLRLRRADRPHGPTGDALESTDVDGVTYWSAPGDAPAPAGRPSVRLLQAYDEYIVGYRQSKHLLDLGGLVAAAPDKLALPNGVIVADTQVAGRWRRTVRAGAVVLEAVLYRPFGAAETAALHAAADELGVFLGARAVVSVSLLRPRPRAAASTPARTVPLGGGPVRAASAGPDP